VYIATLSRAIKILYSILLSVIVLNVVAPSTITDKSQIYYNCSFRGHYSLLENKYTNNETGLNK
jgi:hypothetical protein